MHCIVNIDAFIQSASPLKQGLAPLCSKITVKAGMGLFYFMLYYFMYVFIYLYAVTFEIAIEAKRIQSTRVIICQNTGSFNLTACTGNGNVWDFFFFLMRFK